MIKNIIIISTIFSVLTLAQSGGNTGLPFLKIGSSAKSIALSDIASFGDISSVYYNPASLVLLSSSSIVFTHHSWIQDMSSEIINANFTLWGIPLSVAANTTKINGFEVRTKPTENPESVFDINYFYTSLSSGFKVYDNLNFGFTFKYIYESLFTDDASGLGYDFGLVYDNIVYNLILGFSVRNLGNMEKLRNKKTKLPTDLILNASYHLVLESSSLEIVPVIGIQNYIEDKITPVHVGSEIIYEKQFSLRLGYVNGIDSRNISFGVGLLWKGFSIDYAFTPFSYSIGSANTFSLMYSF